METIFNYKTQKAIRKDDSGIKSIMPIYDNSRDPYARVHEQSRKLEELAKTFPESKFQIEVNAIPEDIYKMLKEDFDIRPGFQDGAGKFFYSPTVNSAIIIHKEL